MQSVSSTRSIHALLRTGILIVCLVFLAAGSASPARGESGLPVYPGFGYGARIDPWGQEVDLALKTAAGIGLDWIGIDFDWARHWPNRNASLDLVELNKVMVSAAENHLRVLVSITHAPGWALTPTGPNPELTAGLVAQLARLYPDVLLAVELFPQANTYSGWGIQPDPEAYTDLLRITAGSLESARRSTVLIAAGLAPIDPQNPGRDMEDVQFLQGLYAAGAAQYMSVIGVRLPYSAQDPLDTPWGADPRVLRRYEAIRKVMLDNQHAEHLIWITGFSWPAFTYSQDGQSVANIASASNSQTGKQTSWFNQAMQMIKSQLYIGAAFVDCLNPALGASPEKSRSACLIQIQDGVPSLHPAYIALSQMVSLAKASPAAAAAPLEKIITPFEPKLFYKSSAP